MHLKNDNNVEIMTGNNTDGIINKLFSWLLQRNQIGSEESMKGSEFVFYYVHWLLYKGNQINLNCNGSYKVTQKYELQVSFKKLSEKHGHLGFLF